MSDFRSNNTQPWWQRQDWLLTGAVVSLTLLGSVLIYSATRNDLLAQGYSEYAELRKHLITVAVGVALALGIARSRYLLLRALAPILYLLGLLGLVLVLTKLGLELHNVKAWIPLPGGFTLQPSEFAKLAIVLGVAIVLAETKQRGEAPSTKQVLASLGLVAVPALLIMRQPDLGTMLIIGVMILGILSVSGVQARWPLGLGSTALLAATVLWISPKGLSGYQKDRLKVFIDPSVDPQGAGYQLRQVRMAIGSGGWTGTGLFEGPQTNGGFIPEQQTDFIFSAAGEQLGFLGAGLITILLFVIVWRALVIASRSSDRFGRIAATGIAAWVAFQTFENIGMNIGIMPMTGVPLPFLSSGGSSMFVLWMAFGLLQNIKMKESE